MRPSFRCDRKATKEELAKRESAYGNDREDYLKIAERVMTERLVTGTLEVKGDD